MRPAADVVEAGHAGHAVGCAQVGGLVERGLGGERIAVDRPELSGEVRRRHPVLDADGVAEAAQAERRLEVGDQRVAQPIRGPIPVDRRPQVRDRQ
jgi:hypothetical protein